jgi:hypothetical protein
MTQKAMAVFGIFNDRAGAEAATARLKSAGFKSSEISVLFPDKEGTRDSAHEKNTKAPEGAATGAGTGAVLGGTLSGPRGPSLLPRHLRFGWRPEMKTLPEGSRVVRCMRCRDPINQPIGVDGQSVTHGAQCSPAHASRENRLDRIRAAALARRLRGYGLRFPCRIASGRWHV